MIFLQMKLIKLNNNEKSFGQSFPVYFEVQRFSSSKNIRNQLFETYSQQTKKPRTVEIIGFFHHDFEKFSILKIILFDPALKANSIAYNKHPRSGSMSKKRKFFINHKWNTLLTTLFILEKMQFVKRFYIKKFSYKRKNDNTIKNDNLQNVDTIYTSDLRVIVSSSNSLFTFVDSQTSEV